MPRTTTSSGFNPTDIENGAFQVDGGLIAHNGSPLCVAVHIECVKETKQCQMVEVHLMRIKPFPEIGPIFINNPMQITAWSKNGLTATGHLGPFISAKTIS
jgi:hypothetical protein